VNIKEIIWDDVEWIDLAENRYKCREFVNAVMNIELYKTRGISLMSVGMLASQQILFCMGYLVS
jgi:hypothetical protein